jgi:voltage-gated potassium channel
MIMQTPAHTIRSTVEAHRPRSYYALLASVLAMTALHPLVEHYFWGRAIMSIAVALSLTMAALAAEVSRRSRIVALIFAALTCIVWNLAFLDYTGTFSSSQFQMAACGMTLLFFFVTSLQMLRDVYTGTVNSNRICGAICVYLMMGFCFAMTEMMIFIADTNAYKDNSAADPQHILSINLPTHDRFPIFIYFSFCTLSTVGYGDINPVSRAARTVAWIEGISGQIYLTVLVARLVGLHIAFNAPEQTKTKKSGDSKRESPEMIED